MVGIKLVFFSIFLARERTWPRETGLRFAVINKLQWWMARINWETLRLHRHST